MLDWYKTVFMGTLPDNIFNRYLIKANAIVKNNTSDRVDENSTLSEVKNCMCELVEYLVQTEKQKGKKSESVGTWSVSYEDSNTYKEDINDILRTYLSNTYIDDVNVLYRGL